jgi:hypothetical protein
MFVHQQFLQNMILRSQGSPAGRSRSQCIIIHTNQKLLFSDLEKFALYKPYYSRSFASFARQADFFFQFFHAEFKFLVFKNVYSSKNDKLRKIIRRRGNL